MGREDLGSLSKLKSHALRYRCLFYSIGYNSSKYLWWCIWNW